MIIAQIQHPTNQQLPIRSRPPPQTPALIQRSHTLIAHTQRPRPTTHTLHQHPTHIADIRIDETTPAVIAGFSPTGIANNTLIDNALAAASGIHTLIDTAHRTLNIAGFSPIGIANNTLIDNALAAATDDDVGSVMRCRRQLRLRLARVPTANQQANRGQRHKRPRRHRRTKPSQPPTPPQRDLNAGPGCPNYSNSRTTQQKQARPCQHENLTISAPIHLPRHSQVAQSDHCLQDWVHLSWGSSTTR